MTSLALERIAEELERISGQVGTDVMRSLDNVETWLEEVRSILQGFADPNATLALQETTRALDSVRGARYGHLQQYADDCTLLSVDIRNA